jgi:nucleoid DNA-binding protein
MAAKKTAAKSKARKKSTVKASRNTAASAKRLAAASKPYTKTQTLNAIASLTGVTKKAATNLLEAFEALVNAHLGKGGAGVFILPGLLKFQVVRKPATRARKGVNPFTGAEMVFKAKPARNVVKVKPLKKLKEMV